MDIGPVAADVAELRRHCDLWKRACGMSLDRARASHQGALAELSGRLEAKTARVRELEKAASDRDTRIENCRSHLDGLLRELDKFRSEEEQQPKRLKLDNEFLLKENRALSNREAVLNEAKAGKQVKKLAARVEAYASALGLRYEIQGDRVLFVFSLIDASDPSREFRFGLALQPDDTYTVDFCEPPVPNMESLLAEVNRSGQFARFVRSMRREFRKAAQSS
ncbi:unnamed protein product [Ostreobium quekettii]|uniref:Kinetochore protein SPC25 n=1 Tax=Ostreobium quekettii TaxID=121088 RepID=A0A8S1J343_9CHLO|nr:unnamed protein product [Ostreobium quekettii]|eukprot:evm.model.scf_318.7 EVM.evm.TU.scf_318.7   scf_318:33722-37686(-)